jgi:hypothetical protein
MSGLRQVVLGFLAALLSSALILGGISMALLQEETGVALALPTPTATTFTDGPSIEITILSGDPTRIALTPTPTETFPPPVCQPPDGWVQRAVGPDETMQSLADSFGLPVEVLAESNCLLPSSQLLGGMILSVPAPEATPTLSATPTASQVSPRPPTRTQLVCGRPAGWRVYYVRHGDTLFSISQAFYTTVLALQRANCLQGSLIHTGQLLYVPNVATRTPIPSLTAVPSLTQTATSPPATLTPTRIPTTAVVPTTAPTTAVPTAAVPTTSVPATAVPTIAVPTTSVPTTAVPPTAAPTTAVPPTGAPTTAISKTQVPVTVEPTISSSYGLNSTVSIWKSSR